MNNVNIEIGNKSFQRELPSCFQELNRSQLLAVSPYVLFNTNNIKIRREIAVLFLDLPERILDMMNLSQFDEIANTFNFLWTINDLTNQLIPIAKSSLFLTLTLTFLSVPFIALLQKENNRENMINVLPLMSIR